MRTLTVQQVATDDTAFAAHLQGLSAAQVFATTSEAADAQRNAWLTGRHSPAPTRLDPHLHPGVVGGWADDQDRRVLVALTWPSPYATPVEEDRLRARTPEQVRSAVAAVLHRVRAGYPDKDLDLLTVADQHPRLDGPTVRRLFEGNQPLDAQTLLAVAEHLHLTVTGTGWTANPTRLRSDLARYAQVAVIAAAIPVHEFDPEWIHTSMGDLALPPDPTSKYRSLFEHLDGLDGAEASLSFGDVHEILSQPRPRPKVGGAPGGRGGRPESPGLTRTARNESWWSTTAVTGKRGHQRAWTAAGYRAVGVKAYPDPAAFWRSRVRFVPFDPVRWALWAPLRHTLRAGGLDVPVG